MYSVDTIVLTFFIYSFLGWVCEVIYCSVPKKRFVNRGFLYGPYLPIYGFGATFTIVLLSRFLDRWYIVFLLGMVITSTLEYITSYLLEKIFAVKLWDYSGYPLNLNGRICALNSVLFGLLCLFIMYVVNEPVYSWLSGLGSVALNLLSLLVVALLSADCALSVSRMSQFKLAMAELEKTKREAEERIRIVKASFQGERLENLSAKIRSELDERKALFYRRTKHIFQSNPSLTVKRRDYAAQFAIARENFEAGQKLRRDMKRLKKEEKRRRKSGNGGN